MKTTKLKFRQIKLAFFGLILLTICCGFDDGCEPTYVPAPPVFTVTSNYENNQTKYYFNCNEKVVIEKIEVKRINGELLETINFGYPFLVSNSNETHLIKAYPQGEFYQFRFSGISRTTGSRF